MNDIEIIKLVFGIMLSVGTVVLFTLYTAASRGNGIFLPVVFYNVNGKEYKVVGPEYKLYKTITKKSLVSKNEMEFEEDNQVFTVHRTVHSMVRVYHNPMKVLYPLHSEIDVYYDSENPKLAYVLRYCNKKWMFYTLFFAAVFVMVMDLMILFGL